MLLRQVQLYGKEVYDIKFKNIYLITTFVQNNSGEQNNTLSSQFCTNEHSSSLTNKQSRKTPGLSFWKKRYTDSFGGVGGRAIRPARTRLTTHFFIGATRGSGGGVQKLKLIAVLKLIVVDIILSSRFRFSPDRSAKY